MSCNSTNWNCLEKRLADLYRKHAYFVSKKPLPFFLVPVLLTVLLSSGFLVRNTVRGADYLFSPLNAEWKAEEKLISAYWGKNDDEFYPGKDVLRRKAASVLVWAKDGKSILRRRHAQEFLRLMDYIAYNVTFVVNNTMYSYQDLCLKWRGACYTNTHASLISTIFANGDEDRFKVTYPKFKSKYLPEQVYLAGTLGGVRMNRTSSEVLSAKSWLISYQLKSQNQQRLTLSGLWELALGDAMEKYKGKLLEISYAHSQTLEMELAKNGRKVTPRFVITFGILILFSLICSFTMVKVNGCYFIDWVISKPLVAISGVMTAIFGVISSLGFLYICRVPHEDMVSVMPFLAVSIGVDNMFLMLNCWRITNRYDLAPKRLAESLSHSAVSITITSFTDGLSFAIGALIPMPAVRIFCAFSSVAILFTFLYQMTFFLAVMVYQGEREVASKHSIFGCDTYPADKAGDISLFQKLLVVGTATPVMTKSGSTIRIERSWHKQFFEDYYAPLLCQPLIQLCSLIMLTLYITAAVLGILRLRIGFEVENLLVSDSPSLGFVHKRYEYYGDLDGKTMDLVVNNPPDLSNISERNEFLRVLAEFEHTPFSTGRKDTIFWFFSYQDFLSTLGFQVPEESSKQFYHHVRPFLLSRDYYNYDVVWAPDQSRISVFRLGIGMQNTESNENKIAASEYMRSLAKRYPKYNLTAYTFIWKMADQFKTVVPQTMQNIGIAMICMVFISLILIPQPVCSIAVASTIVSIDVGVLGYMTWWGVNLDCISMITIVMSIGFSVDFAAHITYGYIAKSPPDKDTPENRLKCAMGTLAWPLIQGALSTILGVAALSTVDAYITQTFFKTVFLVIIFGTLHALIFLPVTLVGVHQLYIEGRSWKEKRKTFVLSEGERRIMEWNARHAAPGGVKY